MKKEQLDEEGHEPGVVTAKEVAVLDISDDQESKEASPEKEIEKEGKAPKKKIDKSKQKKKSNKRHKSKKDTSSDRAKKLRKAGKILGLNFEQVCLLITDCSSLF